MKNNYKMLVILVMSAVFSGECFSETKIGIGTGVSSVFSNGFGGELSMPLRLDSGLLVEPFLGYTKRFEDADKSSPDYFESNLESYRIGVGLYKLRKLDKKFELYYGAALSVGQSKRKFENKFTSGAGAVAPVSFREDTTNATEYMIKPTLGISYLVAEDFTFSVDAGIYYHWGDEERETIQVSSPPSSFDESLKYNVDIEGVDTFTRFIFRVMF